MEALPCTLLICCEPEALGCVPGDLSKPGTATSTQPPVPISNR